MAEMRVARHRYHDPTFSIRTASLYSYVMSYLHISQSAAEWIVAMQLPNWVLLSAILLFVVVLGFFLPPVSIILMTAPIILPPLKFAGFDLVWFGVIMGIIPFLVLMTFAVILLCFFPGIATWVPDLVMGVPAK